MISVALCTYNGAQFIWEQIQSILNQTILVDEIVICDDGSTDETINIIRQLSSKTQVSMRLYINATTLGCVRNFEKAISLCMGDIIFLSDQDDLWEDNKVEIIVKWFNNHPNKDVVISDAMLIDENGKRLTRETYFSLYFDMYSRSLYDNGFGLELFANRNRACGATMAIRKNTGKFLSSIVNNQQYASIFHRCIDFGIIHDYLVAIKAISEDTMGYVNQVLTRYRQHEKQVCGVGEIRKIMNDEAYLIDYNKVDCLSTLPLSDKAKERFAFMLWRSKQKKNLYAPLSYIVHTNQYKKLYGSLRWKFMKYDIMESLKITKGRLTKKYFRWFNYRVNKVFISYGDENFSNSLKRIRKEARKLNIFDKVITYTPKDLSREILQSPLMKSKRGGGYWLWKPYIICKTMERYPNAIVIYADAGCTLNMNYKEWNYWFDLMSSSNALLTHYREDVNYGWEKSFKTSSVKISTWTKKVTVDYFDKRFKSDEWHNINKIWCGFIMTKNNCRFMYDVLDTMLQHPEIVMDPTIEEKKQYSNFCVHRHDQSVITPLAFWYVKERIDDITIIPETAESSNDAAIVASRIMNVIHIPLKTRIINFIKSIIGENMYENIHFWRRIC